MTERISIRISDILASKIRRSGLSKTEYTRRALESYSENKENVMRYNKIATVSECINVLEKFKDNLQCDLLNQQYADFEESVRQKSEICQTNLSDKTDESVRLSDSSVPLYQADGRPGIGLCKKRRDIFQPGSP